MKAAMNWIKKKILTVFYSSLYFAYILVYTPILAGSLVYHFSPRWLHSFIAKRANDTFFHAYYKTLAWLSPNNKAVRQYEYGCSWLKYLTGKSTDTPQSRYMDDDEEDETLLGQDYSFIPSKMRTYCFISKKIPLDLVSMQVITRGLANNAIIKKLEFCPGVITDAGMQVLADFLSHHKTIEEINIMGDEDFLIRHDTEQHFCLQDISIEYLTKALIYNQKLRKLNVSYLMLSKNAWSDIIHLLEHNDRIQEVTLSGNIINTEILTKLTSVLLKKKNVQILDLADCYIDNEGAKIIANLLTSESKITTLKLANNEINAAGLQAIAENLHLTNSLTTLDLSNNKQNGIAGVEAIFKAIVNSTIKNIFLSNMGIDGVIPLAAVAVKENKVMHSMDLSYNNLSDQQDIESLTNALMINTSLENLNLRAIRMGDLALTILTRSFSELTLKRLDLSNNDLLNGSVTETILSMQSLGSALGENKSLISLALPSSNIVDGINTIFITDGLVRNKTLSILDLGNNNISNAEPLTRFLTSPSCSIRTLRMSDCTKASLRQLLLSLAANAQSLKLNTLLSETKKELRTEYLPMIQTIIQYRNQELRSFYYFLAKNNKRELRDTDPKQTLQYLPKDICKKINAYVYAPFRFN